MWSSDESQTNGGFTICAVETGSGVTTVAATTTMAATTRRTTTSRPVTTITRQDGPNVRPDSATGDWSCVLESAEFPNPFSSADCSACCADNECVYVNSISTSTVYRTYNGVANTRIATATCSCARCGMTTQRVPTTTTAITPPPCSSLTGADEARMQMYTSYSYPSWRDYCG